MSYSRSDGNDDESSFLTNNILSSQRDRRDHCTDRNMSTSSAPNHPTPTSTPPKKLLLTVAFLSLLLFAIIDSQTSHRIQIAFQSLLAWISTHLIAGIFALITAYALAAVAFVPGSILTLGSGFVYGKAFGLGYGVAIATGLVFAGASCGAILSFLVGRYLLREWVGETLVDRYPVVGALDQALEQQGFQIFLLLRLSPIIPFNIINYIGGVTAISLKDYTRALIGILPGTVLYCFIGASAGSLSETQNGMNGPAVVAVIAVGIVFGLLAVYVMSSHAKKEFDKIVGPQERRVREQNEFVRDSTHRNNRDIA